MKIGVRHCLPDIFGNLIFFIQKRIQFQREVYSTIPKIGSYGYLDEVAFEDKTFAYDGNERTLYIEGVLPYDVNVRYVDNTLTEIGSQEAKAEFYNKESCEDCILKPDVVNVKNIEKL